MIAILMQRISKQLQELPKWCEGPTLKVYVFSKLASSFALIAGYLLFRTGSNDWNYFSYFPSEAGLLSPFLNWDGQHYLGLAIAGYPPVAGPSTAFYPLLPLLISLARHAGLNSALAGLVLVSLAYLGLLACLSQLLPSDKAGRESLWLFASFPTAFFFSAVYTESLFLFLLSLLLLCIRKGASRLPVFALSMLLPLVRGQGLWIALPAAVGLAWSIRFRHGAASRIYLVSLTGALLGAGIYFIFFWSQYGNPFIGWQMQSSFVFGNSIMNLLRPDRLIARLFHPSGQFLAYTNSIFDKSVFLLMLLSWLLSRRYSKDVFFSSTWLLMLFAPAMMGNFGSYARFALLPWMFFCLCGAPVLNPSLRRFFIGFGFFAQMMLAFRFGANLWVG